jgi:hypothetical protein
MMKYRPRQHKSVHDRYLHTNGLARLNVLEQTTGFGAMQHDAITHAGEVDRNHKRLAILNESHMADQCLVQDAVNRLAVIVSSLGETVDAGLRGLGEFSHECSFGSLASEQNDHKIEECEYRIEDNAEDCQPSLSLLACQAHTT